MLTVFTVVAIMFASTVIMMLTSILRTAIIPVQMAML